MGAVECMILLASTARSGMRHASRMMSGRALHASNTTDASFICTIPAYAEDRALKGAFSGWYCDNGIIYSKHPRLMCALNASLRSPVRHSLSDSLCCLPVVFVSYCKKIKSLQCESVSSLHHPPSFLQCADSAHAVAAATGSYGEGPESGWGVPCHE